MPVTYPYTQYGGIWKLNAASAAQGAATWPTPPAPHLFSWGYNGNGQLGLGNTTYYSSPKQVGSLKNWNTISASNFNALAVKTDGTLWAWGYGGAGELGLGNTNSYSSPKQVGALTNWLSVAAGCYFSIALKTDGSLWVWGSGTYGALGLNNTTSYSSPKQLGSDTWQAITTCIAASRGRSTIAVKSNGTLWSWGNNYYGQLGLGNTTYYSSPKQIGSLTDWLKVSGGAYSVAAVKSDGTLWTWGYNAQGQLGIGNTTQYTSPRQVGALTNWSSVSSGFYHVTALKTNNSLWAWGYNQYGQLGLGTSGNYANTSSPAQVGALTTWSKLSSARMSVFGITSDGKLWSWGQNNYGQLGFSNTTNYSSPKQVGSLTSWTNTFGGGSTVFGIAVTV